MSKAIHLREEQHSNTANSKLASVEEKNINLVECVKRIPGSSLKNLYNRSLMPSGPERTYIHEIGLNWERRALIPLAREMSRHIHLEVDLGRSLTLTRSFKQTKQQIRLSKMKSQIHLNSIQSVK